VNTTHCAIHGQQPTKTLFDCNITIPNGQHRDTGEVHRIENAIHRVSDAMDRLAASEHERGTDTSAPSRHDMSTTTARDQNLAPILELPEGYPGESRLEVSSNTNGASPTPLTGMSSELKRMTAGSPSSDPEEGVLSGEELEETDLEDLETI
jgi:hypothetical protein